MTAGKKITLCSERVSTNYRPPLIFQTAHKRSAGVGTMVQTTKWGNDASHCKAVHPTWLPGLLRAGPSTPLDKSVHLYYFI
jgi:hypothetical protein